MTDRVGGGRPLLGGRYRMGALLATGGMGEVWVAEDHLLDRPVAVKLLGGALAGDGRAAERLRREARAAARLAHPNIARTLDLGEQDGRPYLVMELLEGESLAARLDRAGAMTPAQAAAVVAAVADALEAAHRAGVVHRDVKPGNVFLTSEGEVKVLDFGIASAAGEAALTTGDLLGTAAYLAPERVLGHRATPAADVYALGVVLYELLAGRRPFEAGSEIELAMAHVNARPVPLGRLAPSTPGFLAAACDQAMAKDPAARPPSAAAFARLLRGRVASSPWSRAEPALEPAAAGEHAGPPAVGVAAAATRALAVAAPGTRALAVAASETRPLPVRRRRAGRGRRGLLVALLVVAAGLAALPSLAGGSLPWVGGQVERPTVGQDPDGASPLPEATDQGGGAGGLPATDPDDPPAGDRRPGGNPGVDGGDDDGERDRDDGSTGSGRSGGGDSDGDGSSGPG